MKKGKETEIEIIEKRDKGEGREMFSYKEIVN